MIVRQRYQAPVRHIDSAFEQLTRSFFENGARQPGPAMKSSWVNDEYVLTVDLPGVPADAVNVEVVGDKLHLTVTGSEFTMDRSMTMHSQLDPNKVVANYADGRLTITIGKVDTPEPRSISIDLTPPAPVIDATSTDAGSNDAGPAEGTDDAQSTSSDS